MKKVILTSAIIAVSAIVVTQSIASDGGKKKPQFSAFWGLFKSKNYNSKEQKPFVIKAEGAFVTQGKLQADSTQNNESVLGGAIQWTEKK